MDENLKDNCDGCSVDYALEGNSFVNLYLNSPRHSHARATCPECKNTTIIFIDTDDLIRLYRAKVHINFWTEVHEWVLELWSQVERAVTGDNLPTLPTLPRDYASSLYDTFREFGGSCSEDCGHLMP